MAHRTKLTLAYLGGRFHGWQRQRDRRTVQGELEHALAVMTGGLEAAVVGAGRTDAGVHAAGQVAHLDLPSPIPPDGIVRGLNGLLPDEIRVRAAAQVGSDFHARRSARGKLYIYRARWRPSPLPWLGLRCAVVQPISDPGELARAAALLVGRHDFASFTVPEAADEPTVRTLYRVWRRGRRDGLDLHFVGDGFLRYQVRRMVAALLDVGRGQLALADFARLLDDPRPGAPLQTAPARGLTLEQVFYRGTALRGEPALDERPHDHDR
jgi:tRNA pseudouridine38-40 synthase